MNSLSNRPGDAALRIPRWVSLSVLAMLVAVLSACAAPARVLRTDVTAYHNEEILNPVPRTFKFERRAEQAASLEHESYEQAIRNQLISLGFSEAADARLGVNFNYSIEARDVVVREAYPGFYEPWGMYPAGYFHHRRPYYGWYGGPWGWDPYGAPLVREYPARLAHRELKLDIRDTASGKNAFEVKVVSDGNIPQLSVVMPYMIQAAFTDFLASNGQTKRVEVPVDAPESLR
jgi:hypothetical protein